MFSFINRKKRDSLLKTISKLNTLGKSVEKYGRQGKDIFCDNSRKVLFDFLKNEIINKSKVEFREDEFVRDSFMQSFMRFYSKTIMVYCLKH